MENSIVTFFPVGENNGGMVLLRINDTSKTTILIDCSICSNLIGNYCDINSELRNRLPLDEHERPYVDAFILTHRHDDHLRGLSKNFHLGSPEEYTDDDDEKKIFISELWSSHNFWKPESSQYTLSDDAKAFNKEMKRRVALYKDSSVTPSIGNRAIIIGKDSEGKTDPFSKINYNIGQEFTKINERNIYPKLTGNVLGPLEKQDNEDEKCYVDKNRQSIIFQLVIKQNDYYNKLLLTADAECLVWEVLWRDYSSRLEYDLMTAPHHCSWHSISKDSRSECDNPQLSDQAINALSNNKKGAYIISQSKVINDKSPDPPCVAAKKEYVKIVGEKQFICTNEYPSEKYPEPLEFELTGYGPQKKNVKEKSKLSIAASSSTGEAYPHG